MDPTSSSSYSSNSCSHERKQSYKHKHSHSRIQTNTNNCFTLDSSSHPEAYKLLFFILQNPRFVAAFPRQHGIHKNPPLFHNHPQYHHKIRHHILYSHHVTSSPWHGEHRHRRTDNQPVIVTSAVMQEGKQAHGSQYFMGKEATLGMRTNSGSGSGVGIVTKKGKRKNKTRAVAARSGNGHASGSGSASNSATTISAKIIPARRQSMNIKNNTLFQTRQHQQQQQRPQSGLLGLSPSSSSASLTVLHDEKSQQQRTQDAQYLVSKLNHKVGETSNHTVPQETVFDQGAQIQNMELVHEKALLKLGSHYVKMKKDLLTLLQAKGIEALGTRKLLSLILWKYKLQSVNGSKAKEDGMSQETTGHEKRSRATTNLDKLSTQQTPQLISPPSLLFVQPPSSSSDLLQAPSSTRASCTNNHTPAFIFDPASMFYIEICPALVQHAGASKRGAHKAWKLAGEIVGWIELDLQQAFAAGCPVRSLKGSYERYGKHCIFDRNSLQAMLFALKEAGQDIDDPDSQFIDINVDPVTTIPLKKLPLKEKLSVSVRCPNTDNHKNGDRHPSLVLIRNKDGDTGCATCMVCRTSTGPLTYFVVFKDNVAILFPPRNRVSVSDRDKQINIDWDSSIYQRNFSSGPVGGLVMDKTLAENIGKSMSMQYVRTKLKTTDDASGYFTGRSRLIPIKLDDPIQILSVSDRRSQSKTLQKKMKNLEWFSTNTANVEEFIAEREWTPTSILSVSAMRPVMGKFTTKTGNVIDIPKNWTVEAQGWVLFDLDYIHGVDDHDVAQKTALAMINSVRRNPELSGRCAVIQTGPTGFQIWCELREVRRTPRDWFAQKETKAWYSYTGEKLLCAVHKSGGNGGKVDFSSCSPGRYGRQPGWRILENGEMYRSWLVKVHTGRVRGKLPRYEDNKVTVDKLMEEF